jgi:hypothetical protein
MRLLDQVAQARLALDIEDATGRYQMPAVGALADALTACPTRFIADPNVAAYCGALLATDRAMLTGQNDFLRVPASSFWLEWPCGPLEEGPSGSRTGLLVQAGEDGRTGRVTTIWEQPQGEPAAGQMTVTFDLNQDVLHRDAPAGACALRPGSHPLAPHLLFELRPEWRRHFTSCSDEDAFCAAGSIAESILPGIEFLLVFSALLAERACLRRDEIDLTRLNRQRLRTGKALLLNHAEVRLDLSAEVRGQAHELSSSRESARLHSVRGHMVQRAGHTFWRRSHFRGDPSRTGWLRTVHVLRKLGRDR